MSSAAFEIGTKVVCVCDVFVNEDGVEDAWMLLRCPNFPKRNQVYTIRGRFCPATFVGVVGYLLEEIHNPPHRYRQGVFEPSFAPSCFRALDEADCGSEEHERATIH